MKTCYIILAAGRGSRMGDETSQVPKGLIPIGGESAVERQIGHCNNLSLRERFIVTGYLAEKYKDVEATTIYNQYWESSNMVFSLYTAWKKIEAFDRYIISYSDIFFERIAIEKLLSCRDDCALLFDKNWRQLWQKRFDDPLSDAETFRLNSSSEIIEIGNKPSSIEEIEGQYMGLMSFSRKALKNLFELLEADNDLDIYELDMTRAISIALKRNMFRAKGIAYGDRWGEVDTQKDLNLYKNLLKT